MIHIYALVNLPQILALVFIAIDIGLISIRERWQIIASVIFVVVLLVANVGIAHHFPDIFSGITIESVLLPSVVFAILLRRCDAPRFLFTLCLCVVFGHLMFMIPVYFSTYLGTSGLFSLFTSAVAALVGIALEHAFLGKSYAKMQDSITDGWAFNCICAVLGTVVLLVPSVAVVLGYDNDLIVPFDMGLTLGMVLLFISLLFFYQQVSSVMVKSHELELFKLQREQQERADQSYREQEAAERKRRHDERHTLQAIIDELEAGKTKEAIDHLAGIRGDIPSPKFRFCRHNGVSSMISLWSQRAEDEGIEVSVRADVPEDLEIDSLELSALFGNLLENAYEGCLRLERKEAKRYIDLKVVYDNGRLTCQEQNSCRKDVRIVDGMPLTQKRHGGGIGTYSIRDTVEKYGGMISYAAEDGIFTVRFIMAV